MEFVKEKVGRYSYSKEHEELTDVEEVEGDISEQEEKEGEQEGKESELPSLENLEYAERFMIDSMAFRHLCEDIRIWVFPAMSQYITTTIEGNVRSKDGIFDIRCQAFWEVIKYCQEELAGSWNLHQVLTLTGSPVHAQAASCEDYVTEKWHRKGQILLDSFVKGLESGICRKVPIVIFANISKFNRYRFFWKPQVGCQFHCK